MKKLRRILAALTAVAVMTASVGCKKEITAEDLMANIAEGNASSKYLDDAFCDKYSVAAFTMLKNEYSVEGENVVLSPLAAYYNLAVLANGSSGRSQAEFEKMLGYYSCEDLSALMHSFSDNMKNSENAKLYFENALWFNADKNVKPSEEFLSAAKTYFGVSAFKESFNSQAVNNINNWASNKTDMYSELIVREIPADAPMCIVNTTMLDADWEMPVSIENAFDGKFTTSAWEEEDARMMASYEHMYFENDEYKGFIKPYAGGNYAFLAIVPKFQRKDAIVNLVNYLASRLSYHSLISKRKAYTVDATIPKFSCEYRGGLKEMLQKVELGRSFDESGANLDLIGTCDGNLYASDIYMTTAINVTEKGTSKGSGATVRDSSVATHVYPVALNQPFVFAIVDTTRYLPIILGAVNSVNG